MFLKNTKVYAPKCAKKSLILVPFNFAHSCSTKINCAQKTNGFKVLRVSYLYQKILIRMK